MAKKKKARRSGKSKGWSSLGRIIGVFLKICFRVLPFVLLAGALFAAFMGVRSALYADSNFGVQQVSVLPSQDLSAAKKQVLESQYLGKNILKINLDKIAHDLQADPSIEWAHVRRDFPSTLAVHIKRRIPMALIRFSSKGEYGLISEDGMILDVVAKPNSADLVIEAFTMGVQTPTIGIQIKDKEFREAAKFIKAYWKKPLSEQEPVAVISLDHLGNVSALLSKGPVVRLGRKPVGRLEAMEKLIPLLKDENRDLIEYVDLQYDDVVIKRKGTKK
jgi:cell division septal protein FtsQ